MEGQSNSSSDRSGFVADIEEIIDEARNGRMFIIVDDENRENEGDLVVPAQFATPEVINFMSRYARGLVCLALTGQRVNELRLPLMARHNETRLQTAFTVSIEARTGVTTGISAADRARTVAVAINPECGRDDIVIPGHVFPLAGREGGVLVRAGHTEAAIDIARAAGLYPAGVICEILNENGTMARLPDLISFAQFHNLKIGSIADLISFRRRSEKLVKRIDEGTVNYFSHGEWKLVVYANTVEYAEHLAMVKDDLAGPDPILVRIHAITIDDILGGPGLSEHYQAMKLIDEVGRGVVVIIRDTRPTYLSERVRLMMEKKPPWRALREYGVGAQILTDLGVRDMVLLSNTPRTVVGLEGYGLNIAGHKPVSSAREKSTRENIEAARLKS